MSDELVNIVINGVPLAVPSGEMIIESARRIGVEIPHFCYHPRLSKEAGANCRMCLVEVASPRRNPDGSVVVAKMPKPQTSCSLPAAEGMVIETETPALIEARRGMLEFLLINHPLDCPICDRGGECPLQNNTLHYGPPTTRFVEQKRHLPKAFPLSEYVVLDRERCIHCARCTRFCEDISGDAQLGFLKRGADMELSPHTGERFTSLFSGNTIELCPVGALLSRSYRFQGRPWDLMTQKSICTECANGCNIKLDHRAGRFVRVNARVNEAVNEEWTCDRGKFGMAYLESAERIETPLIRRGARFEPATWDEALGIVAEALRDAGSRSAFIGGTRSTNEDLYVTQRLFREVLGSHNLDHRLGPSFEPIGAGSPAARLAFDTLRTEPPPRPPESFGELESSSVFVAFGADLAWEQPMAYLRVRKGWRLSGCRIVSIAAKGAPEDDRPAALRSMATAVVRHDAGQELETAWLLLHHVVDAVGGAATLPDEVRRQLAALNFDAQSAGVCSDDLARAAAVIAGEPIPTGAQRFGRMAIWIGKAVAGHPGLRDILSALGGVVAASRYAGRLSVPATEVNEQGARDMGILPYVGPGYRPVQPPGLDTAGVLAAVGSEDVRALWIGGMDLVGQCWDPPQAIRALEACPFLMVTDRHLTPTARMADVVLPVASVAERNGTFTNVEGRVQRFLKAYEPPSGVRQEWRIAAQLAARLGSSMHYADSREILADVANNVALYSRCGPDALGDEGIRWFTEGSAGR